MSSKIKILYTTGEEIEFVDTTQSLRILHEYRSELSPNPIFGQKGFADLNQQLVVAIKTTEEDIENYKNFQNFCKNNLSTLTKENLQSIIIESAENHVLYDIPVNDLSGLDVQGIVEYEEDTNTEQLTQYFKCILYLYLKGE